MQKGYLCRRHEFHHQLAEPFQRETRLFPIHCEFLSPARMWSSEKGSRIYEALNEGAAVVLHVFLEVAHYVLLTGIEGDKAILFDPYYEEEGTPEFDAEYYTEGIFLINDQPKRANRAVTPGASEPLYEGLL